MIHSRTPAANDALASADTAPGHPASEYAANDRPFPREVGGANADARPASIKPQAKTPREHKLEKEALKPFEAERHEAAEIERKRKLAQQKQVRGENS